MFSRLNVFDWRLIIHAHQSQAAAPVSIAARRPIAEFKVRGEYATLGADSLLQCGIKYARVNHGWRAR